VFADASLSFAKIVEELRMVAVDRYDDPHWRISRFRKRRFYNVRKLIDSVLAEKGSCRILDFGGTTSYWTIAADYISSKPIEIDLLNLNPEGTAGGPFRYIRGDACDVSEIETGSYDIAHSNSVIEHVGTWDRMSGMASEIRRVGQRYFVQTPNFWFPFEPHFQLPFFHWLPEQVRIHILLSRDCGYEPKAVDYNSAVRRIEYCRLLSGRQLQVLFPEGEIARERYFGLTKSLMAIRD